MENPFSLANFHRPPLRLPGAEADGAARALVHSCCAPCAGEILEAMTAAGIRPTVFFYNPNIHPVGEYEIRKAENIRFCERRGIPFADADYDADHWFGRVRGLEDEPERGRRCDVCFDIRFERAALYAAENGFAVFCSTLGISRWKNLAQINQRGARAAARWPGLVYWDFNWRKQGGSQRMLEIAKRENFYQQEYCGCVYSLRDANRWRRQNNRPRIERGIKFYGREALQNSAAPAGNAPVGD